MSRINLEDPEWCALIFSGRNQDYGAYMLRKRYAKNLTLALLLAGGGIGVCMGLVRWGASAAAEEPSYASIRKGIPVYELLPPPPLGQGNALEVQEQPAVAQETPPAEEMPAEELQNEEAPPTIVAEVPARFTAQKAKEDTTTAAAAPSSPAQGKGNPEGMEGSEGSKTGLSGASEGTGTAAEGDVYPGDQVFTGPNELPSFPGGPGPMKEFIRKEIAYTEAMQGKVGTVYVLFIVEKDGRLTALRIGRGVSAELDAEALRVVGRMPRWKPGRKDGLRVRSLHMIPIQIGHP